MFEDDGIFKIDGFGKEGGGAVVEEEGIRGGIPGDAVEANVGGKTPLFVQPAGAGGGDVQFVAAVDVGFDEEGGSFRKGDDEVVVAGSVQSVGDA